MYSTQIENQLGPVMRGIAARDLRVANRMAVTFVSEKLQGALTAELAATLAAPTPFTLRSIWRKRVNDGQFFTMRVYINEDAKGGVAPSRYLAPLIYGGTRRQKGSERALERSIGSSPKYAVPGLGAVIDPYGNMGAGQIRQILSYVGAAQQTLGYEANTSARLKRRLSKGSKKKGLRGFEYFVSAGPVTKRGRGRGSQRQHLRAGIWKRVRFGRLGSAVKPVLIFVDKAPSYKPRIKFYAVADATMKREWTPSVQKALRIALNSSKRETPR